MNQAVKLNDIEARVEAYIEEQSQLDLLRFITCGSVDDGKSTLIGRMLYEAQMIFEDQVATLRNDSKRQGTQGEILISPCWLTDWRQRGSRASPLT
ncbi:MAG: GTP-binding protein [Pseudomonadales bacterium]